MLIVFLVSFVLHHSADNRIEAAEEARLRAYLIADELRQSSDDLTRMARTYVVTADPVYQARYREILDIRNGEQPRPEEAYNVYWDLVSEGGNRPRGFEPARALITLIREGGFTKDELDVLERSKLNSDKLTETEFDAMAAVAPKETAMSTTRIRAISRLHDTAYHQAKAAVMAPIAKFHDLTTTRTQLEVEAASSWAAQMRMVLIGSGTILLVLLTLLWRSIQNANKEQVERETLFRAVFDNAAVGLVQVDRRGRVLNVNAAFCETFGYERTDILSGTFDFSVIFYSDTVRRQLFGEKQETCGKHGRCVLVEPCRRKDGKLLWMNFFVEQLQAKTNQVTTYIIAAVDVTTEKCAAAELAEYKEDLEKKVTERTGELKESERRFRFIAENTYDVIWTMDLKTEKLTYVSPSVFRLRGFTAEEVMAASPWTALTKESEYKVRQQLKELGEQWQSGNQSELVCVLEVDQPHKDGRIINTELVTSLLPDNDGKLAFVLGVTRDITERKRAEEEIRRLAFFDGLTNLANRRLLLDRLRQSMARADREKSRVALLFIDLDKFKPVNDEWGHETGDVLLQETARRMEKCLRPYDTAARIGGDEFIVLLPDLMRIEDSLLVAERIRASVENDFVMDGDIRLSISASIGVALYPDHGENERELLRVGDEAMYRAKKSGRNKVEIIPADTLPFKSRDRLSVSNGASLLLTWKPAFACGDLTLDTEHQNLFQIANHVLNLAMLPREKQGDFSGQLNQLLTEVVGHFKHEESILAETGYVGLKEHVEKHRALLKRANEIKRSSDLDGVTLSELVNFLAVEVIAQHMLTDDRDYFPHIDAVASRSREYGSNREDAV